MADNGHTKIMVMASFEPDPRIKKQMEKVKKVCEDAGVSLPMEVAAFYEMFPEGKGDQATCGEHTHIFKDVVTAVFDGTASTAIYIPREEIEKIGKKKYNHIVIVVPQGYTEPPQ